MMKMLMAVVLVLCGWYANQLYKDQGLPFISNGSTILSTDVQKKCITEDGGVLYGKVPQGTVCKRLEPVKGSLTIVPSEAPFTQQSDDNKLIASDSRFQCDGRVYCSQMRSCEEATFFSNNCPNVKMDGNNDGVPCEKQWCY